MVPRILPTLIFLPYLLTSSFASPLPSTSISPTNPSNLFRRTISPVIEPLNLQHAASAVGLAATAPVCNSGTLGVPSLWSDCVQAYNSMEEEDTGRVTGYVGNSANLELFESMTSTAMDYLGIPRFYWYGSCIIDISAAKSRQGRYGLIVNSDVAHKNAIKTTAAGVLNHCVRRAQGGGYDQAGKCPSLNHPYILLSRHHRSTAVLILRNVTTQGQYLHLRISVIALDKMQGQALTAINMAKRQGHKSARIHFAFNNPPPNILTDATAPVEESPIANFDPGMILPAVKLPVTACLKDGDTKCGFGVECTVKEEVGTEGLLKVLWGLIVRVGVCDWDMGLRSGFMS
ncbi:MAG: hypothetical protein M1812_008192 [Candelaria pacifica]|nr:MAG: hypothetical protein M1812_008192 [Candelaria pacifica]